jgi:hypothetical protein
VAKGEAVKELIKITRILLKDLKKFKENKNSILIGITKIDDVQSEQDITNKLDYYFTFFL